MPSHTKSVRKKRANPFKRVIRRPRPKVKEQGV